MTLAKNIIPFRFDPKACDFSDLAERVAEHPLAEPGPLELERVGFVSLLSSDDERFIVDSEQYIAFAVGIKKKVIPPSVLNERLKRKVREVASADQRRVGVKERKRFREAILDDMLRQAFSKLTVVRGWIDKRGWLLVDTSSRPNAELVLSTLRKAMGSFPAVPPQADKPATLVFDAWITGRAADAGFDFGEECVLATPDSATRWTGRGVDLCGPEVEEHLSAGARVERMGLCFDDRLAFMLDGEMNIRKFKMLDTVFDDAESTDEGEASEFQAMLHLTGGEVSRLLDRLSSTFELRQPS